MRRSADFATSFKGTRGGANRLLVSIKTNLEPPQADLHLVKVGFVVPKTVGNSVVRHRLYRQLRHLMRERLDRFGDGCLVAVRALPPAKGASSVELAQDLDAAIAKALRKASRRKGQENGEQKASGEPSSSKRGGSGNGPATGQRASAKITADEPSPPLDSMSSNVPTDTQ